MNPSSAPSSSIPCPVWRARKTTRRKVWSFPRPSLVGLERVGNLHLCPSCRSTFPPEAIERLSGCVSAVEAWDALLGESGVGGAG